MYALKITDDDGSTVVEHVSNYEDDVVHVEIWYSYGMPQSEWRKAGHLLEWVRKYCPFWKIESFKFEFDDIKK